MKSAPGTLVSPQCPLCLAVFKHKLLSVFCTFYLFLKMKSALKATHFQSVKTKHDRFVERGEG